ncbi:MAG: calcium-binding protein [Planctomycetota bacterium]
MRRTRARHRATAVALFASSMIAAQAQVTSRISVDSQGEQSNDWSDGPSLSKDGRQVAFFSNADHLVPGDSNGTLDVFVRDRMLGSTERVSVDSSGAQANGPSAYPCISSDGRFLSFTSWASNLVAGDTNGVADVFVHDRVSGETTRASVDSQGQQSHGTGLLDRYVRSWLSADGRLVTFSSDAPDLVPGDGNAAMDIFVHDRATGETTRVSVSSQGAEGNGGSYYPAICADGSVIGFSSDATNLVPGDSNGKTDMFVHQRTTRETTRVSVSSHGKQGNDVSAYLPALSQDGRLVAFNSSASNLVPHDNNRATDEFVHDRATGITTRVSVDSNGKQANGFCQDISMSGDGRLVAFTSNATNLAPDDNNDGEDCFVHDRVSGRTWRVSVSSAGEGANEDCYDASISADGRMVAFRSEADNLVPGDTNDVLDVFLRGAELTLEADATVVSEGQPLKITIYKGVPEHAVALFAVALDAAPSFAPIAAGKFGPNGNFALWGEVPHGLAGHSVTLRGYAFGRSDLVVDTNDLTLWFE